MRCGELTFTFFTPTEVSPSLQCSLDGGEKKTVICVEGQVDPSDSVVVIHLTLCISVQLKQSFKHIRIVHFVYLYMMYII